MENIDEIVGQTVDALFAKGLLNNALSDYGKVNEIIKESVNKLNKKLFQAIQNYHKRAMKLAVTIELGGKTQAYAAHIPGFAGLLTSGDSKKQVLSDLSDALTDWISLALKRGIGLPAIIRALAD